MVDTDERPEYTKLVMGQVICKYGFELFRSQLDMILRLRDSVNHLRWIVFFDTIAFVFLSISNLIRVL